MPARTWAILPVVSLPRSTCFSRSFTASPTPASSAFGATSFMRTGTPFEADW